jgi:hypothetical protein
MIWSPSRKFCFIHISKTGGTSIEEAYTPHIRFGDVVLADFPEGMDRWYLNSLAVGKHSTANGIRRRGGAAVFDEMLSVAVIRDPVARMVSFYRWIHSIDHSGQREKSLKSLTNFESFVDAASSDLPLQKRMVSDFQTGQIIVKYLIPFSQLNEGWKAVAEFLGIEGDLPHVNASDPKIQVDISDAARMTINDIYAEDVTIYSHVCENFRSPRIINIGTGK